MADNILGADDVAKAFGDLSSNLKKRVIRKGLRVAIDIIASEILDATPEHLGILRASGETKLSVSNDGNRGSATFGFGEQNRVALLVEYGHADVGHEPGLKDLGVVAPHPFILPAWDRSLPAALEAFETEVAIAVTNVERPE